MDKGIYQPYVHPIPLPPTQILKITAESLYQRLPQPAGFHNKASGEQTLLGENVALLLLFCLTTDILSFKEPEATLRHGLLEGFSECTQWI